MINIEYITARRMKNAGMEEFIFWLRVNSLRMNSIGASSQEVPSQTSVFGLILGCTLLTSRCPPLVFIR